MSLRERFLDALTVTALGASVVTGVVVVRRELLAGSRNPAPSVAPTKVRDWEKYLETGRLVGEPTAVLKLVEFADFQCPACRALNRMVKQLSKEYPGKIAVSYHYVPLPYHAMAYPAARAAECAADQGRFEAYHNILFEKFDSLETVSFNALAKEVGVPELEKFAACNARTDPIPRVDSDRALALDTLQIKGTPTVIVNGLMYSFAPPLPELRKMAENARD